MIIKNFEGLSMADVMKKIKKDLGPNAVLLSSHEAIIDGHKIIKIKAASSNEEIENKNEKEKIWDFNLLKEIKKIKDGLASQDQLECLESEIKEIKHLIYHFGQFLKGRDREINPIDEKLSLMEISPEIRIQIQRYLSGSSGQEADEKVMRWLHDHIKIAPAFAPPSGGLTIHALVGAAGSGKTSIAAKLAAKLQQAYPGQVGLLAFDHMRLGATEQLRIYSKVLGIDFNVLSQPENLKKEVLNLGKSIVLIDTCGISSRNSKNFHELSSLFQQSLDVEAHLVLSLCERDLQQDQAIRQFASLSLKSLIFTKLDEAWMWGPLINMSYKWSLPISYLSSGQKVPQSLERANREKILEKIFRPSQEDFYGHLPSPEKDLFF